MKKITVVLILLSFISLLTACTISCDNEFNFKYDDASRVCTVKNVSDSTYEDVEITLNVIVKGGFSKEIKKEIGDIEEGKEYTFELTEIDAETQIEDVVFSDYDYYMSGFAVFMIIILILFVAVVIIVFACMIFD